MAAIKWRLELFGTFRLLREDQVVCTFPPSKAGQLLAYLACYSTRTHARQELAERIWPESDNTIARARLRQHLTTLRRQLEPDGETQGSVLRTNRDEISLDPASFTSDIADFEDLVKQAGRTSDSDEKAGLVNRAVKLYKGELLSGYYDHWIQAERERLKQLAVGALQQLASAREAANDLAHSTEYLQRMVAVDPLREESHFELIRLLIAANKPAAAFRQYKVLESMLKTELDAAPSAETRSLIESLAANGRRAGPVSSGRSIAPNDNCSIPVQDEGASADSLPPQNPITGAPSGLEADVLSSVPNGFVSIHGQQKPYRSAVISGLGLVFLLAAGSIGWRLLARQDNSTAHGNSSPASAKGERQEATNKRLGESKPTDIDGTQTATAADKRSNAHNDGPSGFNLSYFNTSPAALIDGKQNLSRVGVSERNLGDFDSESAAIGAGNEGNISAVVARDINPAHRNFSPTALKSGKQEETWIRRYENTPGDISSEPTAIAVDKAGNIYVTGFINTIKTDVDYITMKYSPGGKLLWENRYDGLGHDVDRPYSIAVDTDGSVYVTGESYGLTGSGSERLRELDIVTVKYDGSNGNRLDSIATMDPGMDGIVASQFNWMERETFTSSAPIGTGNPKTGAKAIA